MEREGWAPACAVRAFARGATVQTDGWIGSTSRAGLDLAKYRFGVVLNETFVSFVRSFVRSFVHSALVRCMQSGSQL